MKRQKKQMKERGKVKEEGMKR